MSLNIIRKIACERDNSQVVTASPRDELQKLRLTGLYELLVVLRIVLTLNFQTGWIHQDEFSNSLEVVAGDFFELQVFKPPGFNATFPTRSMVLPQTTICIPYILGYFHTTFTDGSGKESVPITRLLILLPRLFHVVLSFFVDYLMVQYCKRNNQDHTIRLVTLASSQVLLIFATRTHAASINLLLFSLLLYLVSISLHRTEGHLPLLTRFHKAKDPAERVRIKKEIKLSGYSTVGHLHWITLIVVAGIFNDPEFFLSYAAVPLFFYLNRGVSNPHVGMVHFHARCFAFLAYLFLFSIPFVLWDSFYYNTVTIEDFRTLNLGAESFVVAPVNYFVDRQSSFLRTFAENGKTLVNFFVLYNVLGCVGIISFLKDVYDLVTLPWHLKPRLDSQWTFLNTSLFLPLFFFIPYRSIFDMVPLLFPLVYMHGHKIPLISRFSHKIGFSWFVLNLVSIVYFGYISKGGILSSLLDLYTQLVPIRYNSTQVDIIFSQVTMIPPIFVLAIPAKWKTLVRAPTAMTEEEYGIPGNYYKTVLKMEMSSKFRVYHTGLNPLPKANLEKDITRIIRKNPYEAPSASENPDQRQDKINFLILPQAEAKELEEEFSAIQMHYIKTYWNHLHMSLWNDDSYNGPSVDLGLSLYRLEYLPYWKRKPQYRNSSAQDTKFKETFNFHDFFSEAVSLLVNGFCVVFTVALFVMSFLVFLT